MEIELPDGTVLEAPDGSDTRKVVRGYNIAKLKAGNPAEYDSNSKAFQAKYGPMARGTTKVPVRGQGMVEVPEDDAFTEGVGSGLTRFTRGVGNLETKALNAHPLIKMLGGIKLPNAEQYTDEKLAEQDRQDEPLLSTGKGIAGNIVGSAVPSYLTTMGTGQLSSLRGGAKVLTRALGHPTSRAALEGAGTAAAMAPPGEQGEGGVKGALLGSVLERFLAGGGRAIRGLVKKSEAADELDFLAKQHGEDVFVPLSQAAGDQDLVTRLAKSTYREGLPLIPGVKGRIDRQADTALGQVRELALKEAAPDGTVLPPNSGHNVNDAVHAIDDTIAREYAETVGKTNYRLLPNTPSQLEKLIRDKVPHVDDDTLDGTVATTLGLLHRFSNNTDRIHGANLIKVRDELQRLEGRARDFERPALQAARSGIEEMLHLGLSPQNAQRFGNLAEPERHFEGILKAARAARGSSGNFTMKQLATHATDPTQAYLASTAGEVVGQPATKASFVGRVLTGVGLGGFGAFMSLPAATAAVLGGNVMATKVMQKAFMGDLGAQRRLAQAIADHPEIAEDISRAMRSVATTQAGEDE